MASCEPEVSLSQWRLGREQAREAPWVTVQMSRERSQACVQISVTVRSWCRHRFHQGIFWEKLTQRTFATITIPEYVRHRRRDIREKIPLYLSCFFSLVVPTESLTRRPITPSLPLSPSLPPSLALRATLPGLPAFQLGLEASFLPGPGSSLPPSLCDPPSLSTVTSCVCVSPLPPPLPPPLLPCQVYVAVIWVSTATPPFS